jgi:Glycosyl transferases group 1
VDERVDALHLRARFHRLGCVVRDDLPALYAEAACVSVLSVCEGFGLPILEAMAAGAPVVASNCSAMPEVAGDAAVLVDPFSVDAIADGLDRVLGDTELANELRCRGRLRSKRFDWSVTAELTAVDHARLAAVVDPTLKSHPRRGMPTVQVDDGLAPVRLHVAVVFGDDHDLTASRAQSRQSQRKNSQYRRRKPPEAVREGEPLGAWLADPVGDDDFTAGGICLARKLFHQRARPTERAWQE